MQLNERTTPAQKIPDRSPDLQSLPRTRLESIDVFRGLAILGMVLANYLAGVSWIPACLKHARDIGFTITDLVAPMFILAIGLTYRLSFRGRLARDGALKTYRHFITRFFALLGMGALFGGGEVLLQVDGQTVNWGVLQAIGVAGLVTLVFIKASPWGRLAAGVLLLTIYQSLLDRYWLGIVLTNPHGGLLGSISWSAMMLLATVLADIFFGSDKGWKRLTLLTFCMTALALLLSLWLPISKNRVSSTYVLLSLGLSGLLFTACHLLVEKFNFRSRLLVLWGRNPLVMYLLHMILLGIVFLPNIPALYAQAPAWLVIIEALALLGGLTWVAWCMDRDKVYFSV